MDKYYNKLSPDIMNRIEILLIDDYTKIFNKIRKNRLIKNVFRSHNNDPDPYSCFSNPYDEAMEISSMKFQVRRKVDTFEKVSQNI